MSKATHKGHCQCCAKLQMLPSGRLSLHGYRLSGDKYHYSRMFVGQCQGTRQLPLELDRSIVDGFIEDLNADADRIERLIETDSFEVIQSFPDGRDAHGMRRSRAMPARFETRREMIRDIPVDLHYAIALEDDERVVALDSRHGYYNINSEAGWRLQYAVKLRREVKQLRDYAAMLGETADRIHGQPLTPR